MEKRHIAAIKINQRDLDWLSGILEGEGSFLLHHNGPVIKISMIDKDIVERVAKLFHRKIYLMGKTITGKQIFHVSIMSLDALWFMKTLYSLMGKRRQVQISKILKNSSSIKFRPHLSEQKRLEIKHKYIPYRYTQKMLAKEYNVHLATIHNILTNKSWKNS